MDRPSESPMEGAMESASDSPQQVRDHVDVLVIGAGPSGSLAAARLNQQGIHTLIVEKQQFPRFSIGESLLPQLMVYLENAGLRDVVDQAGYQLKNGAAFRRRGQYSEFNFAEKFSDGPGSTYQVKRADFDKRLADTVAAQGVEIRYRQQVRAMVEKGDHALITVHDENDEDYIVRAGFVLDASGYGRVLPRLLQLEKPSDFPERSSLFCHVRDNISAEDFDRDKILISVHPENDAIWYWLIPFSDGTASLGVVGDPAFLDAIPGDEQERLMAFVAAEPDLARVLASAEVITEVRQLRGFAASVTRLHGERYALLGNAAEFLDPVFSSGVTIAFKSAELATDLLVRQIKGETVDWQTEYAEPLMKGVNTFRAFVEAWYDGRLQDIIFFPHARTDLKEKICSILAGYAWDERNPYVVKPERRLETLSHFCRMSQENPDFFRLDDPDGRPE